MTKISDLIKKTATIQEQIEWLEASMEWMKTSHRGGFLFRAGDGDANVKIMLADQCRESGAPPKVKAAWLDFGAACKAALESELDDLLSQIADKRGSVVP